jgi:enoyl-CoA hydratase
VTNSLSFDGGVALVRLSAGKANAMSTELLDQIQRAMVELESSGARSAVITGYDRYFSAGLALPTLIDLDRPKMKTFIDHFNRTMARVFCCPIPVVAAINGHAIAGGCVLALQADVRIMAEVEARIGLNEVELGIGLPAVVVESLRLAVPPRALVPVALEARLFAPREAQGIGLVDEVVPAGELVKHAALRARKLGSPPASGFAQVKAALRRPALEAIARVEAEETERWLDTWFSPPARALLTETVRKLSSPRG